MNANELLNTIESGDLEGIRDGNGVALLINSRQIALFDGQPRAKLGFDGLSVDVPGTVIRCESRDDAVRIVEAINSCFQSAVEC